MEVTMRDAAKLAQDYIALWNETDQSRRMAMLATTWTAKPTYVDPLMHGAAPDMSIALALARHGIKPSVRTSVTTDLSVGDEILSRLADLDADLLVMGAYGHSRIRELVFGGVTRHIARHMTVPTLLSH
jgi:nucleotide-binding universal stress UspA family protein